MGKIYRKDQDKEILILPAVNIEFEDEALLHHSDPHPGDRCPQCLTGYLDYDGLLNLVCQQCGYMLAGCST
jgi:hypothetical protein